MEILIILIHTFRATRTAKKTTIKNLPQHFNYEIYEKKLTP